MLQRLLISSLIAGFFAGVVVTFLHLLLIQPMIDQAEVYELLSSVDMMDIHEVHNHNEEGHHHNEEVGVRIFGYDLERTIFSFIANTLIATGFSFFFASALTLINYSLDYKRILLIGFFGFLSFCLLPSISISPQPPGTLQADIMLRQFLWLLTASFSVIGLGLFIYKKEIKWRIINFVMLIIPHIVIILFIKVNPVNNLPSDLVFKFIFSTIASGAVLWLMLSIVMGYFYKKV
jgi:cobalt transporter subunit CbtA